MNRPPSQAVIEAVEQAILGHVLCDCLTDSATRAEMRGHIHVEVARAAEAAALKVAADECEANARDWYGTDIFGEDIDNLSAWYFREALTTRADILRRMADELTDTDRERVQG